MHKCFQNYTQTNIHFALSRIVVKQISCNGVGGIPAEEYVGRGQVFYTGKDLENGGVNRERIRKKKKWQLT